MKYVYIVMTVTLTEEREEIIPSSEIPEVYATREEAERRELAEHEFLMAVPVQGKDYPLGY